VDYNLVFMRELLSFPNPVNEKAARVLIPLAYGFWARVLTGPKLSPVDCADRWRPRRRGRGSARARPAAGLESIFAYCMGGKIFGLLIRAGLVPDTVCAECADISLRLRAATPKR
jgi:hypothetical protein